MNTGYLFCIGGFRKLKYSKQARFPSELDKSGQVGWTITQSMDNVVGPLHFPDVR
jgi:hypothetical protein